MGEDNRYELKLYDETLLSFDFMRVGELGDFSVEIVSVNDDIGRKLFPVNLEITNKSLLRWLESRVIPKNRTHVKEILSALNLSGNDTKGIIDVCMGLSLTDSYWIARSSFTGKFKDYNLFENEFSEALSLVAYTGVQEGPVWENGSYSPELTTTGMLPKMWNREEDGIYLYKGGFMTGEAANTGNEPYSEYYSSQILEKMDIKHIYYGLTAWKGALASKCKLFTNIDTAFVPFAHIARTGNYTAESLKCYEEIGESYYEELKDMYTFDCLAYNTDRHAGNFGLLRDNRTGEYIGTAPVFDNGFALFPTIWPEYIQNMKEYAEKLTPTGTGASFDKLAEVVAGEPQQDKLKKMAGFRFERHKGCNLSEERLYALEGFINERAEALLKMGGKIPAEYRPVPDGDATESTPDRGDDIER